MVAETLGTCVHKGICSVLFGAHRLVCLLIMRKGCSSNECGKVLSGQQVPSPPWTTLNCVETI